MPYFNNYRYHPKLNILLSSKYDNLIVEKFTTRSLELYSIIKLPLKEVQEINKATANRLQKKPPF